MLANFHSHTNYCDGKNTPEEMVISAVSKGFSSFGFSGHAFTSFGEPFGMFDTKGYINEVFRLKEKYKGELNIFLGIEEDALCPIENRKDFEYTIGSHHYISTGGKVLPLDLSLDGFNNCLKLFGGDISAFAENYYKTFCDYILEYKPDIIGHFDLITKFEEKNGFLLLNNSQYNKIAEKYLRVALKTDCIFEVNTGAMARGYRTAPYPSENLLYLINKESGKIILSSDAHSVDTLDFGFEETKILLKDIGFKYAYIITADGFEKVEI